MRTHTLDSIANESSLRAEAPEWIPKWDVSVKRIADQKRDLEARNPPAPRRSKFQPNRTYSTYGEPVITGAFKVRANQAQQYFETHKPEFRRCQLWEAFRDKRIAKKVVDKRSEARSLKKAETAERKKMGLGGPIGAAKPRLPVRLDHGYLEGDFNIWGSTTPIDLLPKPLIPEGDPWIDFDVDNFDKLPKVRSSAGPKPRPSVRGSGATSDALDDSNWLVALSLKDVDIKDAFTPTSGDQTTETPPPVAPEGEQTESAPTTPLLFASDNEWASRPVFTSEGLRGALTSGRLPALDSRGMLKIARMMNSLGVWWDSEDLSTQCAMFNAILLEVSEELNVGDIAWAVQVVSKHFSVVKDIMTGGAFLGKLRSHLPFVAEDFHPSSANLESTFIADLLDLIKGIVAIVTCGGGRDDGLIAQVCMYLKKSSDYLNAANSMQGLYNICVRMYDRGVIAFTSGDWRDFFTYDHVTAWHTAVSDVLLEALHLEGSVADFATFDKVIERCEALAKDGRIMAIKLGIRDRIYLSIDSSVGKLLKAAGTLSSCKVRARLHSPPFCLTIWGDSSVGKSSASALVIGQCFLSFDLEYNADSIYVHNPGDAYDSGFKNNKRIALVDDTGAIKPTLDQGQSIPFVMRASNIQPAAATKAELDGKGAQYFQFDAIISTSNFKDGGSAARMDYWPAYVRRFKCHVELGIRNGFHKTVGEGAKLMYALDDTKFLKHPDGINAAWVWKICKVEVGQGAVSFVPYDVDIDPAILAAGRCLGKGIEGDISGYDTPTAMRIIAKIIEQHRASGKVTDKYLRNLEQVKPCQTCKIITCKGCELSTALPSLQPTSAVLYVAMIILGFGGSWLATDRRTRWVYEMINFGPPMVAMLQRMSHVMTMEFIGTVERRLPYFVSEILVPAVNAQLPVLEISLMRRVNDTMERHRNQLWNAARERVRVLLPIAILAPSLYWFFTRISRKKKDEFSQTVAYRVGDKEFEVEYEDRQSVPFIYPHSNDKFARPPVVPANLFYTDRVALTTYESLMKKIHSNMYLVKINKTGLSTGLVVTRKMMLLNEHALVGEGPWELSFFGKMPVSSCVVTSLDVHKLGPDLCGVFIAAIHDTPELLPYISALDLTASFQPTKEIHCYRDVENFDNVKEISVQNIDVVRHVKYSGCHEPMDGFVTAVTGAKAGNSGSVLVATSPTPRLLGLQGGMTHDKCFFLVIPSAESIKAFRDCRMAPLPSIILNVPLPNDTLLDLSPTSLPHDYAGHLVGFGSNVAYVGSDATIPPSRARTSFRKSVMWEDMVNVKADIADMGPPQLGRRIVGENPYVYVDPLLVTSASRAVNRGFSPDWTLAVRCYEDYMKGAPIAQYGGPLSLDEALNGAGSIMRLNMSTACGYKMPGIKSQYCEQGPGGQWKMLDTTHAAYISWKNDFYLKNRPLVATGVPKDEIRSFEKIAKGRERIFQCMEFFAGIELRRYLGPFIAWFMHHREFFEHAVGINCQCEEWERLFVRATGKFKYCFDGDFAFFDVTHLLVFLELFHAILQWYLSHCTNFTPLQVYIAHFLWRRSIQIRYVVGRGFYIFVTGFASGHVITIIINCILASMYLRLAYFTIYPDARSYRDFVTTTVFGDDNVNNTDLEGFNLISVARALKTYGIGYTPASKKAIVEPFVRLEDITFLKRRFLHIDGLCLAPLELTSLCKMMAFVKCPPDLEKEQLAQNLLTFQLESWQYGKEMFSDTTDWLVALAAKHNLRIADETSSGRTTMRWRSYDEIAGMFRKGTIPMPLA